MLLQSRRDEHTFKVVNKCIFGNCPLNPTLTLIIPEQDRKICFICLALELKQPRNLFFIMDMLFIIVTLIRIFCNIILNKTFLLFYIYFWILFTRAPIDSKALRSDGTTLVLGLLLFYFK